MALITANELKRKLLIEVDGQPYVVLDVFFASPTARGAATMVRTKLRHLLTGAVLEKSFRSSEKFAEPDVEMAPASFLYSDAEGFHFMDEKSYEQFTFSAEAVGTDAGYLKEGVSLEVLQVQRCSGFASTPAICRSQSCYFGVGAEGRHRRRGRNQTGNAGDRSGRTGSAFYQGRRSRTS